jgi:hypothetical protein
MTGLWLKKVALSNILLHGMRILEVVFIGDTFVFQQPGFALQAAGGGNREAYRVRTAYPCVMPAQAVV